LENHLKKDVSATQNMHDTLPFLHRVPVTYIECQCADGCGSGEISEPKSTDEPSEAREAAGIQAYRLTDSLVRGWELRYQ